MRPKALPDARELAQGRARRAERRRQQQPAPAPWRPEALDLPDAEVLEAAASIAVVPCAGRLVAAPVAKPQESRR